VKAVAPSDTEIIDVRETRWMWFFTKTDIFFADGSKIRLNGSENAIVNGLGLGENLNFYSSQTPGGTYYQFVGEREARARGVRPRRYPVEEGQVLAQGWVDTGDLVLVDKMSYHFREPKRGEVFVFETRGIEKIQSEAQNADQEAGSHYIKRLGGVPGDTLRLDQPHLWHNGKLAQEDGFKRVMSQEDGYSGYTTPRSDNASYLQTPSSTITLGPDKYFALGDNSPSSSDSRYWGDIDEYLLVGPGLFTLWPFENFGFIR
jgi:signal peptidase I